MIRKSTLFLLIGLGISLIFLKTHNKHKIEPGLASINQANVIVYAEPNLKAEKLWKLHYKNWPIFVLITTKNWAKITDIYNTEGWVQKKYIGKPYVMVIEQVHAFKNHADIKNNKYSAKLMKNAFVEFIGYENNAGKINKYNNKSDNKDKYCKIKIGNKSMLVQCNKLFTDKSLISQLQ